MKTKPFLKMACFLLFFPGIAFSSEQHKILTDCTSIVDDRHRLACFDRLAGAQINATNLKPGSSAHEHILALPQQLKNPAEHVEKKDAPSLTNHWELEPTHQRETFTFRPHNSNYILFANHTSSPNNAPFSPLADASPQDASLSKTELRYQLSFKMKLLEDIAGTPADFWFGYTQESNWQLYNREASRPFRETDYQPEFMLVVPVDFHVLGMRARFANLGFVHQSNGRGISISRSWNRIYAQLGMEKDNFTFTGRLWKRIEERSIEDDNPDITDYMGHGDITGVYRWNDHVFSALARYNFDTNRGAAKLGWAFPLAKNAKGYIEAFSGYGHSLIDYNHSQTMIGMGVLFSQ